MDHPYLADRHHKAEANRTAIFLRVVPLVEYKIGRAETDGNEVSDFLWFKVSAGTKAGVIF